MKDSDDPFTFVVEDATDTSGTLAGKRERAPVEGAMDSDIPTQSIGKKSRLEDLHLAFAMKKGSGEGTRAVAAAEDEGKD